MRSRHRTSRGQHTAAVRGHTGRVSGSALPPIRDRVRPGVRVLFVGINPGVRSSLTGHHFAGYSNRFWKLLYDAGLVPDSLTCEDDDRLPEWGYGITNVVSRPSASVASLRRAEYVAGGARLRRTVRRYRPAVVALVGVTVFRALFPEHRDAVSFGVQPMAIGRAQVFVLPNPSGRNANVSYAEMLEAFRGLARHIGAPRRPSRTKRR